MNPHRLPIPASNSWGSIPKKLEIFSDIAKKTSDYHNNDYDINEGLERLAKLAPPTLINIFRLLGITQQYHRLPDIE